MFGSCTINNNTTTNLPLSINVIVLINWLLCTNSLFRAPTENKSSRYSTFGKSTKLPTLGNEHFSSYGIIISALSVQTSICSALLEGEEAALRQI